MTDLNPAQDDSLRNTYLYPERAGQLPGVSTAGADIHRPAHAAPASLPEPVMEAPNPVKDAEESAKGNLVAPKVRIAESQIQHGTERKLSTEPVQAPAKDGEMARRYFQAAE